MPQIVARSRAPGDVRVIRPPCASSVTRSASSRLTADRRKVTIFGSARLKHDQVEYRQAPSNSVARWPRWFHGDHGSRTRHQCRRVTKAPVAEQLRRQHPPPPGAECQSVIQRDEKLITLSTSSRAADLYPPLDALALFPGGFGTLDEGYEALT